MDELVEFLGDAEDLVDALGADLQALRARREDGRERRELVARIFRHAHTLKGSSAALEMSSITEVTHEIESVLDSLRKGRTSLDQPILDILDEAVSVISQLLQAIAGGAKPSAPHVLMARLRGFAQTDVSQEFQSDSMSRLSSDLPDDIAGLLGEREEYRLREALSEGAVVLLVEANFDVETFDTAFKELCSALSQCGEIVATQPGISSTDNRKINFRIVYASQNTPSQLFARLAHVGPVELTELDSGVLARAGVPPDEVIHTKVIETPVQLNIASLTSHLRIDPGDLDALISATHELFADTMTTFDLALKTIGERNEVSTRVDEIRGRFEGLEKALVSMKMVPLSQMFDRAIRAGAVAARQAGKEIEFVSEGGECQLDKSVYDRIADPLLHILRNAVDHGIESTAERKSAGKSERGCIKLQASVDSDQVRILISDDGRGIDPSRVGRAALELGMIRERSDVSTEESLRLIFVPGFSTAEKVTEVSGRGVGLEIVERAVARVGGKILVHSKIADGTTFELQLPSANSIVPAAAVSFEADKK